ncbi:aminotransferase class I/II-fold pyridoxal phosphate-dependent enzyme [Actinomadura rubrisoli]|uniref:Aminotransferase class I/classII large domain-containing protein n=1 Tax=Actinomadura rubrisoli TaxID=2530368 RepID=A0A4R5ABU0_9ACTN|nr:aminotransferase class I/II-fold pyridoxal phosphate-dependent enzyme [Actinomadura rubrisoli]TDD68670.1 hypothetical protein E1298_38185 [Actinomadura rubrisoli]
MIDFSGTAPRWTEEARRLWEDCVSFREESLWAVPMPQGDELLREWIGARFGLDPRFITITAGVRAAALTYARVHGVVHVERPTFGGVVRVLEFAGARVERHSWEALPSVPRSGALWVTSPARNPDGATLDAALCEELGRRAAEGQRVVVNGAYLWFAPGGVPDLAGADLLGSFHKIGGHGCRLGWVYSTSYFGEAVAELLGTTPSPVWQRCWARFAAKGGLDVLAEHAVTTARESAAAFLAEVPYRWPAAPHMLLPLVSGVGEEHALARLERLGFRLAPGRDFDCDVPALRVSFPGASPDDAVRLARAITGTGLFDRN